MVRVLVAKVLGSQGSGGQDSAVRVLVFRVCGHSFVDRVLWSRFW